VTGDVAVSMSEDPDLDTTHLWHMRLGHMSERGLYVLSKQGFFVARKQESLIFMNIVFLASSTKFLLVQVFIGLKTP